MQAKIMTDSEWLPIKTVPKDGTFILIVVKLALGEPYITVAQYYTEYDMPENDASERMRFKERHGLYNIRASHWRPLPSLPGKY